MEFSGHGFKSHSGQLSIATSNNLLVVNTIIPYIYMVCMVYIYICIYICIYMCIYMYIYTYMYMYICIYMYIYLCVMLSIWCLYSGLFKNPLWWRLRSGRNQSINVHCKLIVWFLCGMRFSTGECLTFCNIQWIDFFSFK